MREEGAVALVIGDLQLQLQADIPQISGGRAMGRPSSSDYWDWHNALVKLMTDYKLRAANTFATFGLPQSRIPLGPGKTQSDGTQLDYLLVSQKLAGEAHRIC